MSNNILLLLTLLADFGALLVFFRFFGKSGVFCWTVITSIAANIEVLILVHAFGMEQTLGNVLFASSFLATDILSEAYGKKAADKAVWIGIAANVSFVIISQMWLLFTPASDDWAMVSVKALFSHTPRIMTASVIAYVVSELFDVWSYHAWWDFTTRKCGDSGKFLWLRNNVSTLAAQLINTALFTAVAFTGVYPLKTVISIALSSYVIFIFTSLLDTPFIYFARWMHRHGMERD